MCDCKKLAPNINARISLPLSGTLPSTPKTSSRQSAEAVAWAIGQTPHIRCVKRLASRVQYGWRLDYSWWSPARGLAGMDEKV
jgi:hypothetical protein